MKLQGLMRLLKGTEIKLLEKRVEVGGQHLFLFKRPPGLHWKPGQHGSFSFKGSPVAGRKFRIFSVASTPEENVIAILTKIGANPSAFKARLQSLEKGDVITLRGPFGRFYLSDYKRPALMICGGTGITPMRALLTALAQGNLGPLEVELLYLARTGEHAFRRDLMELAAQQPGITISLLEGRNELEHKIANFTQRHGNQGQYLISGSPSMVKDLKRTLRGKDIKKGNIRSDSFRGY